MKKPITLFLVLALLLFSTSALAAYNDYTDYAQFPLVKEGDELTVSVNQPQRTVRQRS